MIDVIVCSKTPTHSLQRTIRSIIAQEEVDKTVIVTPSSKMTSYLSHANLLHPGIKVVHEPKNFCLSWARRLGVTHTTQRYVCYVDDDVVLGDGYFKPVLLKAHELSQKYPTFAIEGIMHIIHREAPTPTIYQEGFMDLGDRGFTHNTLLPRETALSWQPRYTFAWEDWLLTQHVLSLGGVWLRFASPVVTRHFRNYATWKRYAWGTAGERLVRDPGIITLFRRILSNTRRFLTDLLKRQPLYRIKDDVARIRGTLIGYLKYNVWLDMHRPETVSSDDCPSKIDLHITTPSEHHVVERRGTN